MTDQKAMLSECLAKLGSDFTVQLRDGIYHIMLWEDGSFGYGSHKSASIALTMAEKALRQEIKLQYELSAMAEYAQHIEYEQMGTR